MQNTNQSTQYLLYYFLKKSAATSLLNLYMVPVIHLQIAKLGYFKKSCVVVKRKSVIGLYCLYYPFINVKSVSST